MGTEKKTVIIYGNCHTTAIRVILEQYSPFLEKYVIIPIKPIQEVKNPSYFTQECFKECDVFVHQSIRLNNRYGEEYASERIIQKLKPSCRIIAIPNVYHLPLCFFPQYEEKTEWKSRKGKTIFFRDKVLDDAYKQGLSVKETTEKYLDVSLFDENTLREAYDSFDYKVKMREKDWDIKVSNFIENNYQTERLFYDPNHPTTPFIMHIVRELLVLLDVEVIEEQLKAIKPLKLYGYEMPITRSVYNTFNMSFKTENIRYDSKNEFSNMSLEKYIKYYWLFEWQNDELADSLKKDSKKKYIRYQILTIPNKIIRFTRIVLKKLFK